MSEYRAEAKTVISETKWTLWKVLPIIVGIIIFISVVTSLTKVGGKAVERQVIVTSHQYKEGMEQRANVLKANITEIDVMISTGQGDKAALMGQKRVLRSQLLAITK